MTKATVIGTLVVGMGLGYIFSGPNADASPSAYEVARYLPTVISNSEGDVCHFCMTNTSTGETICTEGMMYDFCFDESGHRSVECIVTGPNYYAVSDQKYYGLHNPFDKQ